MKLTLSALVLLAGLNLASAALTEIEVSDLKYMREEEKLARDVYLVLYGEYGNAQFGNIAKSEQRHTDSVLRLLDLYGVEDPALAAPGAFSNPDLQALYDQLIEMGMQDRISAFQVGVLIEETDITDLEVAIARTQNPDIIRVYTSLRNGSFNHLDAFTAGLAALTGFTGATYQDGWFHTWMGWVNLDAYPWVKDDKGQWRYHVPVFGGGRFMGTPQGDWIWTADTLYPWCYDMKNKRWSNCMP